LDNSILAIDIGTTNIVAIVASNDYSNKINILGVGQSKSEGLKKGNIIDIENASRAINEAVSTALNSSGTETLKATVSLPGSNTKTLISSGVVNIPSGQITLNDIKQVLSMALYNSNVIPDYEVIHVLPIYFRVDDGTTISNPLNMTGSRIEVTVNIITAKKTILTNIRSALKQINIDVDKFVLTAYANAIATLDVDQKKLGAAVINLGGTTSQFVVYKGTTILYNDFLPVGSENITHDIVATFHTPYSAANMIKKQYATLLPYGNSEHEHTIRKVKLPTIGNEAESKEIALEQIQPVIHARIEETLSIIHDKLVDSTAIESIDGGVILTGGMTFIPGIKELASKIFNNIPVKIAHPRNIQNGYINFDTPAMTTIVGLLLYELESENSFELDSNCNLRDMAELKTKQLYQKVEEERIEMEPVGELSDIQNIKKEAKPPKKSGFSNMLDKFAKWI